MRAVWFVIAAAGVLAIAWISLRWFASGTRETAGPTPSHEEPVAQDVSAPDVRQAVDARTPELDETGSQTENGNAEPGFPVVDEATLAKRTGIVAGRLIVGGGPPGETLELLLQVQEEPQPRAFLHWSVQSSSTPDGRFRFEGVPSDWSGEIALPFHYRVARVEDRGTSGSHAFRARAGDEELLVEVLRQPTLRGRILRAADRTPVATVSVGTRSKWGDSIHMSSAHTDESGRFQLPLRSGELIELELSCRSEEGEFVEAAWNPKSLPAANELGDVDLGDLYLAPSQVAALLVLGPAGAPFEGARVVEVGTSEGRQVETDAQGRATLQLTDALEGFQVRATGFSLVELPRPAPGEELEVRLAPASTLSVQVIDLHGLPWPDGRLRLKAARPAFEGGHETPVEGLFGPSRGGSHESGRDREGAYALFRTLADGSIEWPGIVPGLALEVTVEDAIGTVAARASVPALAPGELRSVRLQLAREPLHLRGRCVDATGAALVGARVSISLPGAGSAHADADENGAFESAPLFAASVRVRAGAAEFADLDLGDVALPAERTIVLRRGRALRVVLRDASGVPLDVGQVRARADTTSWSGGMPKDGTCRFEAVADVGLELEHVWHGRKHQRAVPDGVTELDWELPALGRIEVEVDPSAIGEHESGHLALEALDGRGIVEQTLLSPGREGAFRFTPWPGRYRLRRVVHAFDVDADGWRTPAGSREIGAGVEVEVTAGRIAQAEVRNAP